MGFCGSRGRLGSVLYIIRRSGNLEPRSRVGGRWVEITKR